MVNVGDQGYYNGTPSLNFGYNPELNSGSPGITYSMQESSGVGGQFALIQLANLANSYTVASSGQVGNQNTGVGVYVLDTTTQNTVPQYNDTAGIVTQPPGTGAWTLYDVPALGLISNYSAVTGNQTFQTYFMYQPPTAGAIWVTLGAINWSWAGTATVSAGSWSASATSFSPSPAGATVTCTNSNTLPIWSSNVTLVNIRQ